MFGGIKNAPKGNVHEDYADSGLRLANIRNILFITYLLVIMKEGNTPWGNAFDS